MAKLHPAFTPRTSTIDRVQATHRQHETLANKGLTNMDISCLIVYISYEKRSCSHQYLNFEPRVK